MTSVVAVPGLWMRGVSMASLRRRLEATGLAVHVFDYPSVTAALEANAASLAEFVDSVPGDAVHLVGHSLGGVLIRTMLERGKPLRVGRVVCLGSPLRGSRTARRVARLPCGRRFIGKSMVDLLERGGFAAWAPTIEAGSIAGDLPFGFGRLFGRFREPNDGTVAVAETMLAGQRDHVVLPVSHVALLWSTKVAEQVVAFLRDGSFAAPAAARPGSATD